VDNKGLPEISISAMAGDNDNEVMTLAEVAEYLQLAEKTVLRMVQRGEIPGAKIASQWRFMRSVIRDWLAGQMQAAPFSGPESVSGSGKPLLSLDEVIRPELMRPGIEAGPKEHVLGQLVEPLRRTGFARDPQRLLAKLIGRERMMTTAIGHGVAIPHPRRPIPGMFPEPAIVTGVCREGTMYEAVDDRLVHVFFLICATREEIHLQLMAKASWLSRQDIMAELKRASSQEEITALITKVTEGL